MSYWKAVRLDGRDWHTGSIDYAAALESGGTVTVGVPDGDVFPGPGWLHVATVPTECVGAKWPSRLLIVEPLGELRRDADHPHKVGCRALRVVEERPGWEMFGPQGRDVVAVIDAARDAARAAAWDAAWDAARDAAWAALAPTKAELQADAHRLVDRMLAVTGN